MSGPPHYMLACTVDAAQRTAVFENGWKQAKSHGVRGFIDPQGEFVIPTSSADRLSGLRKESKIYLGRSFLFAHGDARAAIQHHRDRGGEVIDLSQGNHK